jgi:hypothetical protein
MARGGGRKKIILASISRQRVMKIAKKKIEEILNRFPEVTWDRWSGNLDAMQIFGWIERDDGRADFLVLKIVGGIAVYFTTSSAQYSREFTDRLNFIHRDCKRCEKDFPKLRVVKG